MADLGPTKVYGDLQVTGGITGTVTGNADKATKLQTARTIGGVAFDGTANINLPGVNAAGNQNTSGNAATATKLATPRTINGVNFDGSANITVEDSTKLPLAGGDLTGDLSITKSNPWLSLDSDSTGGNGVEQGAGISIGESGKKGNAALHLTYTGDGYGHIGMGTVGPTSGIPAYRAMSFYYENANVTFHGTISGNGSGLTNLDANQLASGTIPDARLSGTYTGVNITGNAATATKLATSRTVALTGDVTGSATFDGSANITITATVQDDSHNHVISNVDGLQTALDEKANAASLGSAAFAATGYFATAAQGSLADTAVQPDDISVTVQGYDAATAKLNTTQSWTAEQRFSKGTSAAMVGMGAGSTIDLAKGNGFTKTISGATTLSLSNVPAAPLLTVWLLELTNGGSGVVTWWSGISWAERVPPTLTAAGRDVIGFYTADGGATSIGFVVGLGV